MSKIEGVNISILSKELNYIKQILSDNSIGVDYAAICVLALEILEYALGEHYDFPIDIQVIAEKIGVNVIYQPLNGTKLDKNRMVHKLVGTFFTRPSLVATAPISCIMIDSEANPAEQRYALAHELAHCLIHKEDKMYSSSYRVMPMLFRDMEEVVADIFAIFILIPLPIFLNKFYDYIISQNEPVKTSEWLQYLSIIANVPYEDVAIGYQNIRYVFGMLYKIKNEERGIDKFKEKIKRVAFEENAENELSEIAEKQVMKVIDAICENVEGVLFV